MNARFSDIMNMRVNVIRESVQAYVHICMGVSVSIAYIYTANNFHVPVC